MPNLSKMKTDIPGWIGVSSKLERFLKKNLNVGIVIINKDLQLLWANDTFRVWFGKFRRHQPCCNIHSTFPDNKCPALLTFKTGLVNYWVGTAAARNGEKKLYRFTAIPIRNNYGKVEHVLEVIENVNNIKNISDLESIEEAFFSDENLYDPTNENSNLAIFCLDRSGNIISTNPEHLRLAQAPKEKVLGLNWIAAPKSRELGLSEFLSKGLTGEPFELFDFRYTTYRGDKEIYMNIKGIPLFRTDGHIDGLLCIVEDTTKKTQDKGSSLLIGQSAAIKSTIEIINRIAPYPYPVLIEGESGTGKELVAQEIHLKSTRSGKPFVAINAAAFQDSLLESELFGHVRGAFTGAAQAKKGLLEIANSGTFFIDEIGEMSQAMQAKLLRILETGTFRPIGDTREINVNIRIIAATNRKLADEVARGNFREDLFYRLNVVKISLPPLRKRKEDIPLLARHFLEEEIKSTGVHKTFSPKALEYLENYNWPGNVRELKNTVKYLVALTKDEVIKPSDLPIPHTAIPINSIQHKENKLQSFKANKTLAEVIDEIEKQYITEVLKKCRGDKTKAADILGISIRSLYRKIAAHGIDTIN